MIDYFSGTSSPVPNGELYRYCKEEGLDYLYTVSNIKDKRRATRKRLNFFKRLSKNMPLQNYSLGIQSYEKKRRFMEENRRHLWGDIQLLIVAIIWGLGFVAAKIGLQDGVEPFFLMALRFSVAAVSICPIFIIHYIKTKKRMLLSTLRNGILLGMLNFLEFFFQTVGLRYTTASNNAVLMGVNVMIVPFLAFLLTKKKVKAKSIFAAFFTLIGISILSLNEGLTMNIGDLLTLVSAVMLAFHITITGIVAKDDSSVDLVLLQMITGAVLSIISTFVFREVHVVTATSMLAILYLGIFCTMLAFLLQTIGQRYAHATQAAVILSTESLFGPIFAILILGETLGPRLVIGGVIIFTAIFLSEYEFESPNKLKEQNRSWIR